MVVLLIVVHGPLLWPDALGGTLRAHAGAVVPADDPALAGQEWRCHGLPEGDPRGITPHESPAAARWYAARGYDSIPFADPDVTRREAAARAEQDQAAADAREASRAPRRRAPAGEREAEEP